MPARSIWKGVLDIGRDKLPVKLYAAVEDSTVHFHLIEKRTHQRVKQRMVDPATGKEVAHEDIRKGYEIERDTFVILEDEEIDKIQPAASTSIEVAHFLPEGAIGYQYYDHPYYLGPDGDAKAYFALAEALAKQQREGLAHWTMRKNEYSGALRSRDGYLLLITLRTSEQVLTAKQIGPPPGKAPSQQEIAMAEQLVAALQDEFRAEDYRDEYRDRVMKHIEAKAKGRKPKLAAMPSVPRETTSLLKALTASLKGSKVA